MHRSWNHSRSRARYVMALTLASWLVTDTAAALLFPPSFAPGSWTKVIGVADLDGDGTSDMVVGGSQLSTWLGDGRGTHTQHQRLELADRAMGMALGDVDGDGLDDAVVGIRTPAGLAVHRGLGDGRFAESRMVPGVRSAIGIAMADFDEDGLVDLAVTGASYAKVTILRGDGTGAFTLSSDVRVPPGAGPIVAADFDRDAHVDFVTSSAEGVALLRGQGDGTFGDRSDHAVGVGVSSLVAFDMNGDGALDLATTARYDDRVDLLINRGDGTFDETQGPLMIPGAGVMTVADFDGDDVPDLGVQSTWNDRSLRVLLGRGDGSFAPPIETATHFGFTEITTGHFDRDGRTDVAGIGNGRVHVLFGRGDGRFDNAAATHFEDPGVVMGVVDVTGDGVPDLLHTNPFEAQVAVLEGDGHGGFEAEPILSPAPRPTNGGRVADVDGDGVLDVLAVYAFADELFLMRGLGDGTFEPGPIAETRQIEAPFELGDFDEDGVLDLVHRGFSSALTLLRGNGDGTFGEPEFTILRHRMNDVEIVDANADGHLDVVATNRTVHPSLAVGLTLLLGLGDGHFAVPIELPSGESVGSVDSADLDANGLIDFVAGTKSGLIELYLARADGSYAHETLDLGAPSYSNVRIADLDRNGVPDLAVTWRDSQELHVLPGLGDGTFGPPRRFWVGGSHPDEYLSVAAHADLDGAGALDVILWNATPSRGGYSDLVVLPNLSRLPARIDLRPSRLPAALLEKGVGVVAVTLFGSEHLDVEEVAAGSLAFGPAGATARRARGWRPRDVDRDGFVDLTAVVRLAETGIAPGDTEACLVGRLTTGEVFEGCSAISTAPICGDGYAVALIVPVIISFTRRRGRAEKRGLPPTLRLPDRT